MEFNQEEIKKIKEYLSEKDIIDNQTKDNLENLKKDSLNRVSLCKLFLYCYDLLRNNLYQFDNLNEGLRTGLFDYINSFDYVEDLRDMAIKYSDGKQITSPYASSEIDRKLKEKNQEINNFIQFFFRIFEEEDV